MPLRKLLAATVIAGCIAIPTSTAADALADYQASVAETSALITGLLAQAYIDLMMNPGDPSIQALIVSYELTLAELEELSVVIAENPENFPPSVLESFEQTNRQTISDNS